MDNIVLGKKPKNFLKEKILRFKPVVFLRKNIIFFSFILIISLSILVGIWNMKKYEIQNIQSTDIPIEIQNKIEEYLKENIFGYNFFLISPLEIEKDLYKDISYIKSMKVEKVVPNKIILFVQLYDIKYATQLKSNQCLLLCSEGIVLEEICIEDTPECCLEYSLEKDIPFIRSSNLDISKVEDKKDRLLITEDINKVVKVVESFSFNIDKIILENDTLEVFTEDEKLFRFSMTEELDIQLKRYLIVMAKINTDYMEFGSLDLRFERPVMKD